MVPERERVTIIFVGDREMVEARAISPQEISSRKAYLIDEGEGLIVELPTGVESGRPWDVLVDYKPSKPEPESRN